MVEQVFARTSVVINSSMFTMAAKTIARMNIVGPAELDARLTMVMKEGVIALTAVTPRNQYSKDLPIADQWRFMNLGPLDKGIRNLNPKVGFLLFGAPEHDIGFKIQRELYYEHASKKWLLMETEAFTLMSFYWPKIGRQKYTYFAESPGMHASTEVIDTLTLIQTRTQRLLAGYGTWFTSTTANHINAKTIP